MPRTIVVLSRRLGAVLPAAAFPALRAADRVLADPDVPESILRDTGAQRRPDGWHAYQPLGNEVLLTLDAGHPMRPHAEAVIETPEPVGAALQDAVAVMDRLRSPGGCPWDAEQTHTSLLRYLIEEAYELHQAVDDADRPALREELGDVLLQVLFHARLATEGGVKPYRADAAPFGIDEVAADLVAKLVSRHPHVFAGIDEVRTASDQERRWDELKRLEKQRESALDGVARGQPAVALAAKLVSRARKARLPEELCETNAGDRAVFDAVVKSKLVGLDPEEGLRKAALGFATLVREAEDAARSAGLDPHALTEDDWRRFWPSAERA